MGKPVNCFFSTPSIIVTGHDNCIQVIDLSTNSVTQTLPTGSPVTAISVSKMYKHFVVALEDKSILLYDDNYQLIHTYEGIIYLFYLYLTIYLIFFISIFISINKH